MNLYIGYNHDNEPIGVLLAVSEDKAQIAWTGMGNIPHHIEVVTQEQICNNTLGCHGVVFLLCSKSQQLYVNDSLRTFNIFKRGLE